MSIEELKADKDELSILLNSASRSRVRDIISREISVLDSEILHLRAAVEHSPPVADKLGDGSNVPKIITNQLRSYAWDQSDKFVKIYITLTGAHTVDKANISCKFTSRSFDLLVSHLQGKNYTMCIKGLLNPVDTDASYAKTKTDTVLVMLKKSNPGTKWDYVTEQERLAKEKKTKTPKFDKDADPNASLMNMMKEMYDEGDDDLKRTMAKAWTESREKQAKGGMDDL